MTHDESGDDSKRFLDQQYDHRIEENGRAERTRDLYNAIRDGDLSRLRTHANMDPPGPDIGAASGDLFDVVLAAHRQLLRTASSASDDAEWFGRINRLELSDPAKCQAEIAGLCRMAENDGGPAAALRRFEKIYRGYADEADGPRLIEPRP